MRSIVKEYRDTKIKLKQACLKAKNSFEIRLAFDKRNPKRLFSYINNQQKISQAIRSISRTDGKLVFNANEIADILNQHFESVFDKSAPILQRPFQSLTNSKIEDIKFTEKFLKELIEKLDQNKSQGCDRVNPRVLRECASEWTTPLKLIFELSLSSGTVPKAWREANVTPIFKKGLATDPANYRPISLTSIPCKLLEKLIKLRFINHFIENNLFSKGSCFKWSTTRISSWPTSLCNFYK